MRRGRIRCSAKEEFPKGDFGRLLARGPRKVRASDYRSGTKDLAEPHKSCRNLVAGAKSAENRAQGSRGESDKEGRVDDGCESWF